MDIADNGKRKSNWGKRCKRSVYAALAVGMLLFSTSCQKKVKLDEIAGKLIVQEKSSDTDDYGVYENEFFNFGIKLNAKDEIYDRNGAYDRAKEIGWTSTVDLIDKGLLYYELAVENLRKGDGKYIDVEYYEYNPQSGRSEKEICDNQKESRRKDLEIGGYKIYELETVEISFAGKDHYVLKEHCYKSGQHSYSYRIYYIKSNALCYISLTSYESEEDLNNLLASCYELELK